MSVSAPPFLSQTSYAPRPAPVRTEAAPRPERGHRPWFYIRIALAALLCASAVLALQHLPLASSLARLVQWARSTGLAGMAVYGLFSVLLAVFLLPITPAIIGAGFAFGPWKGALLMAASMTAASLASLFIARNIGRDFAERHLRAHPHLETLLHTLERGGFKFLFLLRLALHLPFGLTNLALGLTRVPLRSYMPATTLGVFPGALLFCYAGSLITNAQDILRDPTSLGRMGSAWHWTGLGLTLVASIYFSFIAKREFARR